MIARFASRDSDLCTLVFAAGSYEYGLLDAGLAGVANLEIPASASGMDADVVKPGTLVQIMPQRGFPEWVGLVTAQPAFDARRDLYVVQALELHGFLSDIASVSSFVSPIGGLESVGSGR